MKNTFFLFLAALFFSASVNAQTTVDSIAAKYKLLPMPEALTIEKTFPVIGTYQLNTTPVSTTTATTTTSDASGTVAATTTPVTITLDETNKGMIWVSGLPQGKFKAYLKRSPATYRILAQKTEDGKDIPEGTLIFNPETNTLNIALGKSFDETNPASIFDANVNATASADVAGATEVKTKTKTSTSKTKTKIVFYTANKDVQNTSATGTTTSQQ